MLAWARFALRTGRNITDNTEQHILEGRHRWMSPSFLIEFVTEIFAFCFDFFRPVSSIIIDKKRGPGGTASWWEREFRKRE